MPHFRLMLLGIAALLLSSCAPVDHSALPAVPVFDSSGFLPGVTEQLQDAALRVKEQPYSEEANGHYAMVLHAYQQFDPSAIMYERAIGLSSRPFLWLYLYADMLIVLGRPNEAEKALEKAQTYRPMDPWINSKRVVMLHMSGAPDRHAELQKLEQLLSAQDELPEFHYTLGRLYAINGELLKAIDHYQRSIELAGPFGAAYYASAMANSRLGNGEEADRLMSLYQRYRDSHARGSDPYLVQVNKLNLSELPLIQQAESLISSGRLEQAVAHLELAIKRNPKSVAAHISMIGLNSTLGNFKLAEHHFEMAQALEPERAKLHYNLGLMRLMQQRYVDAENAFRESIARQRENADAYVQLALVLRLRGFPIEADANLKRALKFDPANRAARLQLAEGFLQQGRAQDVIDIIEEYYHPSDGGSAHMLLLLTKAYGQLNDHKSAMRYATLGVEHAQRWQQSTLVNQFKRQQQLASP